jgi:hypothetical protein
VFSSSEVSGPLLPDLNVAIQEDGDDFQFPDVLLPFSQQAPPPRSPQNFLASEIQPDELMNDEEIAAQELQRNV